jgi:glycosyltransferase involved in cell wall biosynthesis
VAAATKLKTKDSMVVYHQHGLQYLNDFSIKTLLQRPFMTLAQKKTDFSFVVTGEKELAAYVAKRKNLQNKLVAIGSPIDLNLQKPKEDLVKRKGNTFIYVGRLAPIKRVRMLVKAYDRFCQRNGNDYKLFIVGDGEQRNKVERAVIATGLDSITLTGSVSEERVKEYLAQADYYITASAGEGASVAVLEAFAAGLPVVCFSVRGLREQVIAQKTGAVAKEETIEGLVNAMECVMKDRAELSKNCRLACMPYTKDLIGKRIVTEIDERYGKRT